MKTNTIYYIDKNGTIRKVKPLIIIPRHYGKTFTLLKQILSKDNTNYSKRDRK